MKFILACIAAAAIALLIVMATMPKPHAEHLPRYPLGFLTVIT